MSRSISTSSSERKTEPSVLRVLQHRMGRALTRGMAVSTGGTGFPQTQGRATCFQPLAEMFFRSARVSW